MYFKLILEKAEPSNDFYFTEIPNDTSNIAKEHTLSMEDAELLYDKYAERINVECDVYIGDGDANYFNAEQCKKIIKWLEKNIDNEDNIKLKDHLTILLQYAKEAVELGTWIIIEI